jgi:ABC-2 type transport system permease protein
MLRAEILKLTTTTSTRVAILIAALGLVLTQLAFTLLLPALREDGAAGADVTAELPVIDMGLAENQLAALNPFGASMGAGSIGVVIVAVVLLGVLAGTGDFRYGGITGAALAEPRRFRIVLAKAGAAAATGAVTGVLLAAAALLTLGATLLTRGTPFIAPLPQVLGLLGRGVLAVTLLTLVGLAVGLILRNQLAAVLVMLGALVVEPVLMSIVQLATGTVPLWVQLLPVSLSQAAVGSGTALAPGTALGALAALAATAVAASALTLRHRDL